MKKRIIMISALALMSIITLGCGVKSDINESTQIGKEAEVEWYDEPCILSISYNTKYAHLEKNLRLPESDEKVIGFPDSIVLGTDEHAEITIIVDSENITSDVFHIFRDDYENPIVKLEWLDAYNSDGNTVLTLDVSGMSLKESNRVDIGIQSDLDYPDADGGEDSSYTDFYVTVLGDADGSTVYMSDDNKYHLSSECSFLENHQVCKTTLVEAEMLGYFPCIACAN